jgi:hypothetical protein
MVHVKWPAECAQSRAGEILYSSVTVRTTDNLFEPASIQHGFVVRDEISMFMYIYDIIFW